MVNTTGRSSLLCGVAKVMFLHVSVILSTGGVPGGGGVPGRGVCAWSGGSAPGGRGA